MKQQSLFADVLQGKADMSALRGLPLDELKRLKNCAATKKHRELDANRSAFIVQIIDVLNEEVAKLTKPKAKWRTGDPMTIDLVDVQLAIESARWYKSTYGPSNQKINKELLKDRNSEMFARASHFMDQAPTRYAQACADEAYWLGILSSRFPEEPVRGESKYRVNKQVQGRNSIRDIINEMSRRKHLSAADQIVLERLKGLL